MNLLDVLAIVVIAFSIVMSAMKGFVRELFGLAAVVLGFLLGALFYRNASELFKGVVNTENLALFFGFSIVFLGTLFVGFLAIWLTTKFVKFAKIQWFDRLLGAAFGFIRGWVLVSVIYLGLTSFDVQAERVKSSQLAPYFLPGARIFALLTPTDLKARFFVGYQKVEKWWREQP
jgi:membrane protein required for colicin V production